MAPDLAVVVMTCDKYSDVWNPFYTLLFRYWKDCPFTIYNISENKKVNNDKVISISTGEITDWGAMLIYGLTQIKEKYILYLQEDYLLLKPANTKRIEELVNILEKEHAAYIRIFPSPPPDSNSTYKNYSDIGIIAKNSAYSICTQATIWNKEILKNFIVPKDLPWEFEINGSQRAHLIKEPFLSLKRHGKGKLEEGDYPYTYFCTAVLKGKWMRGAIKLCKKENIPLDLNARKVESRIDIFKKKNIYKKLPSYIQHYFNLIFLKHD